ncbi:MAG TPA: hypothetical protein VKM55_25365 [Candidatus Lokiarchaeia archaeon]|nr:hypothetical protein [Candidatus Lokiarchaeia archaeon]
MEKSESELKKIVILLGDPKLFDPVAPGGIWDEDDFETIDKLKAALGEIKGYEFSYLDDHKTFIDDLRGRKGNIDLVFNLCDEGYYNDPRKELHVAALLEILGFPYTGATPQSMAIRLDKSIVKGIARMLGVPTANGILIDVGQTVPDLPTGMDYPLFVKPNNTDAGQGITRKSICHDRGELEAVVAELREGICKEMPILVEDFLSGKDLTTGVIGNPGFASLISLPIAEEDYSMLSPDLPHLCGWEAKWDPQSPYWQTKSIRADLTAETEAIIVEATKRMFKYTECRDYARFDWRLDDNGKPKLLDVNCNPGWCWDSHMVKLSSMIDVTYPQMLEKILEVSIERIDHERTIPTKLYQP